MISAERIGEVSRFGVVGTIGFLVDAAVLTLLFRGLGLDPLLARIPSFLTAVCSTWLLHRRWTFRGPRSERSPLGEFGAFLSTQLVGIGINYACFTVLVLSGPPFATYPVLALAVASVLALGATYTLAREVVFSAPRAARPVAPGEGTRAAVAPEMDRVVFTLVAVAVGFLGAWAVLSQVAVLLGATFAPMRWLFVLALLAAGAAGYAAWRQPILCFGVTALPPTAPRRPTLVRLVVLALALSGGFAVAYALAEPLLFFAAALAVVAFGLWETARRPDLRDGGLAACGPVRPHQRWVLLALAVAVVLLPLTLHRPDADDANFLNLSVGMIADPRPVLTFDTMLEDPSQPIHLPTYRVETHHVLNAVIADLSGLSVIQSAHLVLPALSALLLLGIYVLFCRMTAGGGWLLALLVALTAVVAFGVEHKSFGNFAFMRLQQGKALLFAGVIPLLYVFVLRFWHGRGAFDLVMLFLLQAAAVSLSANGLYAAPLTVFVVATGLLIFEPGKVGAYVLTGLSCAWPVAMAAAVLLTTGAFPSEYIEPVPILRDVAGVYGGSPRALLTLAALAGWVLLAGPARRLFLGVLAVYVVLLFNPFLSPVFAEQVTGNLNWRMLFVLPLPLFLGMAVAAAADRLALPARPAALGAAVVLVLVAVSPASIFDARNGVHVEPFGLDVPEEVYEEARALEGRLTPGGVTLAPEEMATWLSTFEDPPAQVGVRDLYLRHYRHTRPADDVQARRDALAAVTAPSPSDDGAAPAALSAGLDRFGVTDLVLRRSHPDHDRLMRAATEAGFAPAAEGDAYLLLQR